MIETRLELTRHIQDPAHGPMHKEGSCSSVWAIPPLGGRPNSGLQEAYSGLPSAKKTLTST